MATTVDTLITKYVLDDSRYKAGARNVVNATNQVGMAQNRTMSIGAKLAPSIGMMGSSFSLATSFVTGYAAAILAATTAVAGVSVAAMQKAAGFEALTLALEAVEGGGNRAAASLERLRKIAKAPGIGFAESIEGYTQLRRSGFGQGMSESILREFANANAAGGGGREEFSRIMRAITQMKTKPNLQGDELLQLSEARIPAYKMIEDAFGTSDTEKLKSMGVTSTQVIEALVRSLEKTKRVGGGAKNAFDNLSESFDQMLATGGKALNETLLPIIEAITKGLEEVTSDGTIKASFSSAAQSIQSVFEAFTNGSDIPSIMRGVAAGFIVMTNTLRDFYINITEIAKAIANNPLVKLANLHPLAPTKIFDQVPSMFDSALRDIETERGLQKINDKKKMEAAVEAAADPESGKSGPLGKIERNTRETVAQLQQLERNIFGGGDVGQMGVTPSEVQGITGRGRGGNGAKAEIQHLVGLIFDQGVSEGLIKAKRAGLLGA